MGRLHSKNLTSCTLNSQSILADLTELGWDDQNDTHDTTAVGDADHSFTPGLHGGSDISLTVFYNNTNTTGTYALLTGLLGGTGHTLSFGDGTRTTSCSVLVTKIGTPIKVADMVMLQATLKMTGAVTYS